jgi:hypothetical protein
MKQTQETINVRLIYGRGWQAYFVFLLIFFAGMMWFVVRPVLKEINATPSEPTPYTLDLSNEPNLLTYDPLNSWNILVTVRKGDLVETRFYDRRTGRLEGTVLTKAQPEGAVTNPSSAP